MKKINTILILVSFSFIFSFVSAYSSKDKEQNEAQTVTFQKMWQTGDYWKVQTYDGHTGSGKYYAVDFYYNNRNRSEIYKNSESGVTGRPILAPVGGSVFVHLLDVTSYGTGNFPSINAVRVFQGLDPIPQSCFSFTDSLGSTVRIDMSLIIDFSSNSLRTNFSHLLISSSYFNTAVQQKIRNGVRALYNRTAVGSPRRVAVSTGSTVSVGNQTGTMSNSGLANDYHLHFQIFSGSGYSETSPYLGTSQDLSNNSTANIEGQTILNITYEANIGGGVYQYPAMLRRTNLAVNDAVQVNSTWDGGGSINIRSTPGGPSLGYLSNGSIGTLLNQNPVKASNGTTYHLWYNVYINSINGWIASEFFDISTSSPQLQLTVTPTGTQIVDWGQLYSFNFTVTSNNTPVANAYISVQDAIRNQTIASGPTNSSGQTSYSYTVPNNYANGTYIFGFYANKTGYQNSPVVNRNVQVQHNATGSASVLYGVVVLPYPVIMGSNLTTSFALKETQGASVTYEQITCAILKNDGTLCFDMDYANNITILANNTYYFTSTKQFPLGSYIPADYKAMAKGKLPGGSWANFPITQNGINPFPFPAQYPTFQIACTPNPVSGGYTSGSGTYTYGQTANLLATSNSGYNFVNWTENGTPVWSNANWSFTVISPSILVANFSPVSGINSVSGIIPTEYNLFQNYPNPFNPTTVIKFDIPNKSDVKIIIYDVRGSEVFKMTELGLSGGQYSYQLDGSKLSSGAYFCKLVTNNFSKTIKLTLIK
ncbi:MAG: T9SS type A sorting domain-containing protein [Ignavibacteriae bacterium]|nr:T9SS type A sorting domain-containing protein [Ignavibacteriota bacterium]